MLVRKGEISEHEIVEVESEALSLEWVLFAFELLHLLEIAYELVHDHLLTTSKGVEGLAVLLEVEGQHLSDLRAFLRML